MTHARKLIHGAVVAVVALSLGGCGELFKTRSRTESRIGRAIPKVRSESSSSR